MERYYVNANAQPNGDHEVHKESCRYLPNVNNRMLLGYHESCYSAVEAAKKIYPLADGCAFCCPACNKR